MTVEVDGRDVAELGVACPLSDLVVIAVHRPE